jgi:hypothetical protein
MLRDLAAESGYAELAAAPMIPIGHSAMASYPDRLAQWNPGRCAAALSIKGDVPAGDLPAGVPLLFISGEYEDAQGRAGKAAAFRAATGHGVGFSFPSPCPCALMPAGYAAEVGRRREASALAFIMVRKSLTFR